MADNKGNPSRAPRRARKKKVSVEARRTKVFTYRGHTMEELMQLPAEEIIQLLPSRARRFMGRMSENEDAKTLLAKVQKAEDGGKVRTHIREFPILPIFVGKTLEIHNGKEFKPVTILPEMIGHKLGEFSPTRGSVKHTGPGVGATRSSKFMPLK